MAAGSSAERAGLCEGDVVVQVNGEVVEREYLKEVVRLIMCGGSSVRMLVMDRIGYKTMRQGDLPYTATVPYNKKVRDKNTLSFKHTHTFRSFKIIKVNRSHTVTFKIILLHVLGSRINVCINYSFVGFRSSRQLLCVRRLLSWSWFK